AISRRGRIKRLCGTLVTSVRYHRVWLPRGMSVARAWRSPGARAPRERGGRGEARGPAALDVEVERVLPRMGAQPYGVHLVLALVLDPRLDHVRRKDVALQQPIVRLLEVIEHDAEVAGELLDLLRLGGRQLVEVLIDRLARIDLVGDAVEPRHQARREAQVRIAGRVGRAELDALGTLGLRVHRDADARRAVALTVDEVDRRLVARHQPLVGVGRGRDERQERRRVFEDAADVVEAGLGAVGVPRLSDGELLTVLPR